MIIAVSLNRGVIEQMDDINKYIGKMIMPVTLCMHCKYRTWFAPGYGCGNFNSPFYKAAQEDVAIMTKPDDFCSYGEPR